MKIAVTGATGYIGRAVLSQLIAHGIEVIAFARTKQTENASSLLSWHISVDGLPSATQLDGCEAVIHLAGRAHTKIALANGTDLFDATNRQLAIRTALAAQEANVTRFIFVSTLGVHGNWSSNIVTENSPIKTDTPYAHSKWNAEKDLSALCEKGAMTLCIVRPPMVYGPHCPGNFSRLVRLVKVGLPLPFSSITAMRSFIHIDNLASFLVCAAMYTSNHKVFVIGDGSDWTLPDLIQLIANGTDTPTRLYRFPLTMLRAIAYTIAQSREMDSLTRPMQLDSTVARHTFNWTPLVNAPQAISQTLVFYKT